MHSCFMFTHCRTHMNCTHVLNSIPTNVINNSAFSFHVHAYAVVFILSFHHRMKSLGWRLIDYYLDCNFTQKHNSIYHPYTS